MLENKEREVDYTNNNSLRNSWKNILSERKILLSIIMILGIGNAMLVIGLVQKETQTHLVPDGLGADAWVSNSNASKDYKEAFGLMVAKLAGNVNPGNVDFISERLSRFASPELFNDFKISLYKEAEIIKIHRSEQSFVVKSVSYDKTDGMTYVTGLKTTETPDGAKDSKVITYKLDIQIFKGMPVLNGFWVNDGNPTFKYQEDAAKAKEDVSKTKEDAAK
jgi:type IV conjugative transfer system protein TraE